MLGAGVKVRMLKDVSKFDLKLDKLVVMSGRKSTSEHL